MNKEQIMAYVLLVKQGKMTLEQVPLPLRDEVEKRLVSEGE